jgi:hypothetical protein
MVSQQVAPTKNSTDDTCTDLPRTIKQDPETELILHSKAKEVHVKSEPEREFYNLNLKNQASILPALIKKKYSL